MNSTKLLPNIQNKLQITLNDYPIILKSLQAIWQANGIAYLVGGAVRDLLMGLTITDFDIEVHNIDPTDLYNLLKNFTEVNYVGKSFGVIKMANLPIDWSLPRSDSSGRKPLVTINPNMPIEQALVRRDLTMNAIAINLQDYQIIDPFNGYQDIQSKILRTPDVNFFVEDPLRFFRVMQFVGRFEMTVDSELEKACKNIDISKVSIERKEQEFDKLLLKSNRPSLGLRWLKSINRLKEILPELYNTINIIQDSIWHPEGSVFEHLMQALDASATIECDNTKEKITLRYAAICHDLGKTTTTKTIKGRVHSYGHEIAGVPLATSMMHRITTRKELISSIKTLVRHHMMTGQLVYQNSSLSAYKRLALRVQPYTNLNMLAKLLEADIRGRNGESHTPLNGPVSTVEKFIEIAKNADILHEPEQPILTGQDVMDIVEPGPKMGTLLKFAYDQQISVGIKDKDTLKKVAQAHILDTNKDIK